MTVIDVVCGRLGSHSSSGCSSSRALTASSLVVKVQALLPGHVRSQQAPSELLYPADGDFRQPVTELLPPSGSGWTALPSQPGKASVDFIRGNLFDPASRGSLRLRAAVGPEAATAGKVFYFRPGNGVHDVHMNQAQILMDRVLAAPAARAAGRRIGGAIRRLDGNDLRSGR
ncbi:DUF2278 family protein [Streptomyces sp. NPDC001922]|uniref:DUF2278 family protein n=1 Tax=Streptomyces sp. NPDC001922 TaxID=3364624 RepID=UPI0036BABADF